MILVHGVHGYEEHMKDVARRFAALGYAAIVPALYSRNEFLAVGEEEDLSQAAGWLAARPHAQANGELLGTGCLMHQSDYPHNEAHFPDTAGIVIDWPFWQELGDEALKKHMPGNAESFLRLI